MTELATLVTFNACLGQMLTQQVHELAAQRPNANILSQSPTQLLPLIMRVNPQDKPQIWTWTARDLLKSAMQQSRHGVPEHVSRAVEAWEVGSTIPIEEKHAMIRGVQLYLEDVLSSSLRELRGGAVSTVRSIAPPPSTVVPAAVSANSNGATPVAGESTLYGGAPFDALRDGGIPLLGQMIDQLEIARRRSPHASEDEIIRSEIDRIPYPIAVASLLGDDGLGPLLDSNLALNSHFGWRRVPLDANDRVTGVRGRTIKWVLHPNNFAIARILLLRPGGSFKPSKMKFLRGEHRNVDPKMRMDDVYYINCIGAGRVTLFGGRVVAFGIFTELADSVSSPRPK